MAFIRNVMCVVFLISFNSTVPMLRLPKSSDSDNCAGHASGFEKIDQNTLEKVAAQCFAKAKHGGENDQKINNEYKQGIVLSDQEAVELTNGLMGILCLTQETVDLAVQHIIEKRNEK